MSNLKVSDIKQFLNNKKDEDTISVSTLELMVKKTNHNQAIVNIIKSCVDNYIPSDLKQKLVKQMRPEGIIQELIPTIALGRRAGHSTAAINYAKQTTDKKVYIVTYTFTQVEELKVLLGIPRNSICNSLNNVYLLTVTDLSKRSGLIDSSNSVIIFDSTFSYESSKITSIITDLYLEHSVIFLGN